MYSRADENYGLVIPELLQLVASQGKTLISLDILIAFFALMRGNHQHINNPAFIAATELKLSHKNIGVIFILFSQCDRITATLFMRIRVSEGKLDALDIFWKIEIKFQNQLLLTINRKR